MAIIVNVDVMLAKRKMSSGELAERIGITPANLSILKTNKAKAIRFSTLEKICEVLDCKPGDILDYEKSKWQQADLYADHNTDPGTVCLLQYSTADPRCDLQFYKL